MNPPHPRPSARISPRLGPILIMATAAAATALAASAAIATRPASDVVSPSIAMDPSPVRQQSHGNLLTSSESRVRFAARYLHQIALVLAAYLVPALQSTKAVLHPSPDGTLKWCSYWALLFGLLRPLIFPLLSILLGGDWFVIPTVLYLQRCPNAVNGVFILLRRQVMDDAGMGVEERIDKRVRVAKGALVDYFRHTGWRTMAGMLVTLRLAQAKAEVGNNERKDVLSRDNDGREAVPFS